MESRSNYPLIYIPEVISNEILEIQNSVIGSLLERYLGEKPKPPIPPARPESMWEPTKPSSEEYRAYLGALIFVLLFDVFLFWINKSNLEYIFYFGIVSWIPFTVGIFWLFIKKADEYNTEMLNYKVKKIEFEKWKSEYDLEAYALKKQIYEEDKYEHSRLLESYNEKLMKYLDSKEFQNIYRAESETIFAAFLKDHVIKHIIRPSLSEISYKSGISELFFHDYLKKFFPHVNILRHFSLIGYEPDFVIELPSGLFFDIEIDEPYVGNSKEVIHFYDRKKNKFSDEPRNIDFLECGWVVIRFSEQQIFEYPKSCCKKIAKVFDYLYQEVNWEIFKDVPDLKQSSIWSQKEADEMAHFDLRKNYIPKEVLQKLRLD